MAVTKTKSHVINSHKTKINAIKRLIQSNKTFLAIKRLHASSIQLPRHHAHPFSHVTSHVTHLPSQQQIIILNHACINESKCLTTMKVNVLQSNKKQ